MGEWWWSWLEKTLGVWAFSPRFGVDTPVSLCTPPREAAISSGVPIRLAGRCSGEAIGGTVERIASGPSLLFEGCEEASLAYAARSAGPEDNGTSVSISSFEMTLASF